MKKLRTAASVVLAVVFVFSTVMMLRQYFSDREAEETYSSALELALRSRPDREETVPATEPAELVWVPAPLTEEDPYVQELEQLDLSALREVNPDVVGWIRIPDTKVDYPFLQGEDNDYYLNNTWDNRALGAGSIFLECTNSGDMTDFNTIMYGHNMRSGSMFASIRRYTDQNYWEAHPYVYILTDAGVWRYEVFAAYQAPVDSYTYGVSFNQQETKEYFLYFARKNSKIKTGITPAVTDRVLTLSTCSGAGYGNRWVVQARLEMIQTEAQ